MTNLLHYHERDMLSVGISTKQESTPKFIGERAEASTAKGGISFPLDLDGKNEIVGIICDIKRCKRTRKERDRVAKTSKLFSDEQ